ncbi:hypothetical protein ACQP1G_09390 [Nocardia sp. CA-107356]|uniref:hypothetical protein n=1 Tax=Nocardia sp. CA-107356 TaxID=3239972 RepID=UPI003D907516
MPALAAAECIGDGDAVDRLYSELHTATSELSHFEHLSYLDELEREEREECEDVAYFDYIDLLGDIE